MDQLGTFAAERPRLVGIASKVLADPTEAEDVVQHAWLRLHGTETDIDNLPAWLTTVTVRLCVDRLRQRTPELPGEFEAEFNGTPLATDPSAEVELAETVGVALHVVLDRLTPRERVAFVLHDSFGFEFPTIAAVLDSTPTAARKLASRARAKVRQPRSDDPLSDWEVVDAFLTAAREGDFTRLLQLLAPRMPRCEVTRQRSWPARPSASTGSARWRPSSTAQRLRPCQSLSMIGLAPRGSTAGRRGWPSISPSLMAWCDASTSAPVRTCSRS